MIKNNKWKLIISSIITLVPMLFAVLGYKILPDEIAVHWGIDGNADGFASPMVTFLLIPVILLAVHWSCMILTAIIDKNNKQNKKIIEIIFWIIPTISLVSCGMVFAAALGYTANMSAVIFLMLGVVFIIIGNYIPKTTRNLTVGIKLKWTQSNDENWNATHRFAGKVWVIAGFICLLAIPLPFKIFPFVAIAVVLLCTVLPTVYSYRFYKKQLAEGKVTAEDYERGYAEIVKNPRLAKIITAVLVTALAIFLSVIMFTGKMEIALGDDAIAVNATFCGEVTINYEDIDSVEYRDKTMGGSKVNGFNSAKLLLGVFQNEEFGTYTRYTYNDKSLPCVVLKIDGQTVVLNADNEQAVKDMYERISAEIAQ